MSPPETAYVILTCVIFYIGVLYGRSTAVDRKWFKMWAEADRRSDEHFRLLMATRMELDRVRSEQDAA